MDDEFIRPTDVFRLTAKGRALVDESVRQFSEIAGRTVTADELADALKALRKRRGADVSIDEGEVLAFLLDYLRNSPRAG